MVTKGPFCVHQPCCLKREPLQALNGPFLHPSCGHRSKRKTWAGRAVLPATDGEINAGSGTKKKRFSRWDMGRFVFTKR
jgi:hypothetical protein